MRLIVPHGTHYTVEIVYEQPITPAAVDLTRIAAIDLGLNNLATLTTNLPDFAPVCTLSVIFYWRYAMRGMFRPLGWLTTKYRALIHLLGALWFVLRQPRLAPLAT
jgi:hypothetical protein